MMTLYFKTLDDKNVAIVRNVPMGRGRGQAAHLMRSRGFVLISQAEHDRLKAQIDARKQAQDE